MDANHRSNLHTNLRHSQNHQEGQNAPTFAIDRAENDDYCLYGVADRRFLLEKLVKQKLTLNVYTGHGHRYFLTTMLAVEPDRLVMDSTRDLAALERARQQDAPVVETELEHIKIQFHALGLSLCKFRSFSALACKFPPRVLRLQRREFFRVPVPNKNPASLHFEISGRKFSPPLLDLSLGGLAFAVPDRAGGFFAHGSVIRSCTLVMPGAEKLNVNVRVCQVSHMSADNPHAALSWRIGCCFDRLSIAVENRISNYITQLERARKML